MLYDPYIPLVRVEIKFTIEADYELSFNDRSFINGILIDEDYTSNEDVKYRITELEKLGIWDDHKFTLNPQSHICFVIKPSLYLESILKLGDIPHYNVDITSWRYDYDLYTKHGTLINLKGNIYGQ